MAVSIEAADGQQFIGFHLERWLEQNPPKPARKTVESSDSEHSFPWTPERRYTPMEYFQPLSPQEPTLKAFLRLSIFLIHPTIDVLKQPLGKVPHLFTFRR